MTGGAAGSSIPSGELDGAGLREFLQVVPIHGSTADAVTDALREAILSGALPPSTWLREDDLAAQLSVSRTPIRVALRRLADEQLAVQTPHRGTVVAGMTIEDLLAVYLVRESLEGLAARTTATRRTPATVLALRSVHQQMEDCLASGSTEQLAALNLDFHRLLREGSENAYLNRFLIQVERAVRRLGRTTFEVPGRSRQALDEHQAILDAIEAGDADAAAQAAQLHMRRAREVRIAAVRHDSGASLS